MTQTLGAMKALAERIARHHARAPESGHPIDLTSRAGAAYLRAADEVSDAARDSPSRSRSCVRWSSPARSTPPCTTPSARLHGLNCYHTYGPDFMTHDLGHYLGAEFEGETLEQLRPHASPKPRMPLYHLVGALDPLDRRPT